MEQLKSKLATLKNIQPDADFVLRTRMTATALPQFKKNIWLHIRQSIYYSLALGLSALLLVTLIGRMSYIHLFDSSPMIIGSLQTKALMSEADLTNFEIQLADAQYFEDTANAVATALQLMHSSTPDHLNEILLEKELKQIEEAQQQSS